MHRIEIHLPILIPEILYRLGVFILLKYRRLRYGYPFRLIRLGQGQYSKVDQADYEWLNKYDWHLYIRYRSKYAARMDHEKNTFIHMHRQIFENLSTTQNPVLSPLVPSGVEGVEGSELKTHNCHRHIFENPSATQNSELKTHNCHRHIGDGLVVDHINCDGLDNRRANLRLATRQQNKCNSRPRLRGGTSRYKGVFWAKDRKKWRASVSFNGKTKYLGGFDNEIEAAKVRDVAAKKYHGQFAWLNFG